MQTKTTHTPGPWTALPVTEHTVVVSGYAIGKTGILAYCDSETNAHLMAAAPELLEALEAMLSCCTDDTCPDAIRAEIAIAKARGGS